MSVYNLLCFLLGFTYGLLSYCFGHDWRTPQYWVGLLFLAVGALVGRTFGGAA